MCKKKNLAQGKSTVYIYFLKETKCKKMAPHEMLWGNIYFSLYVCASLY